MTNKFGHKLLAATSAIVLMSGLQQADAASAIVKQSKAIQSIEGSFAQWWYQPDTTKNELAPLAILVNPDGTLNTGGGSGGGGGTVTQGAGAASPVVPWIINNTQINGVAIATGTGASGTGTQRVVTASDSPDVTGLAQLHTDLSTGPVPISSTTLATAAKQPALGSAGSPSIDVGTVQGCSLCTPVPAAPSAIPGTGGIATLTRVASVSSGNSATNFKNSGGRLYTLYGCVTVGSDRFIHFVNTTTAPTAGSTTVFTARKLAASTCTSIQMAGDIGMYLGTGMGFWLSTGAADTDTGALTAGDIILLEIGWR